MRLAVKGLLLLTMLAVIGGGASMLTWRLARKTYGPPEELEVRTDAVTRGSLAETISAPGVIQPRRNVKIGAKLSARIVGIPVSEGDTVTAGKADADPPVPATVLVRLDDRDLRSRLRAAQAGRDAMAAQMEVEKATLAAQEADLLGLNARFRQTTRDYERKKTLLASRDIAEVMVDEAESRYLQEQAAIQAAEQRLEAARQGLEVLRYRIEAADADIEQANEALEYTVIRAPIDGTVTVVNAEEGEMVVTGTMNNPGTVIMEIADLDSMILVAEVDEADVGKVAAGKPAAIHVQAYADTEIQGVVESIALTHRNSSRGTKFYQTDIRLIDPSVTLYSGLTANVDVRTTTHDDVLLVPTQSVLGRKVDDLPESIRAGTDQLDGDKTFATVVYRVVDGKTVATPVTIGAADMTHTIIEAGLREGDAVVSGPYKVLNDLKHDRAVSIRDEDGAEKQDDGGVGGPAVSRRLE